MASLLFLCLSHRWKYFHFFPSMMPKHLTSISEHFFVWLYAFTSRRMPKVFFCNLSNIRFEKTYGAFGGCSSPGRNPVDSVETVAWEGQRTVFETRAFAQLPPVRVNSEASPTPKVMILESGGGEESVLHLNYNIKYIIYPKMIFLITC